ncbi:MAG: hypothetical protein ACFFDK_11945 [Promethearchaeota archaeon]
MIDKAVLKYYIIGLVLIVVVLISFGISNMNDYYSKLDLYTLPFGDTAGQVEMTMMLVAILAPYLALFIGYGLGALVVKIYCRFTKISKKIIFVGYAKLDRSGKYLRKRYLLQLLFATVLCINIWIYLVTNVELMTLFLSDEGKKRMFDSHTGQMFAFVMFIWYWVPLFIATLVFAMCAVIQDSGLVSIKKISGQSEFVDTERVGDLLFGFIKGYAGISVIINFYLLLTTPLGREGSLIIFPLLAAILMFHLIIAIDLFRSVGVKWVHKVVKGYYPPQLIELTFNKTDIDPNELIG